MIPDGEALRVLLEVSAEPIGDYEEFSAALRIGSAPIQVVVSQPVLRDGNRVVLQADLAMIVELRNASGVVEALIVRLLANSM